MAHRLDRCRFLRARRRRVWRACRMLIAQVTLSALQRRPIPASKNCNRFVGTLKEVKGGVFGLWFLPHVVIVQNELAEISTEVCRARRDRGVLKTVRWRVGVGIESRPSKTAVSWPEPAAA